VQEQAALLQGVIQTKVIALGIGNGVDMAELEVIATDPDAVNAIRVNDFNDFDQVADLLRELSCTGLWIDFNGG